MAKVPSNRSKARRYRTPVTAYTGGNGKNSLQNLAFWQRALKRKSARRERDDWISRFFIRQYAKPANYQFFLHLRKVIDLHSLSQPHTHEAIHSLKKISNSSSLTELEEKLERLIIDIEIGSEKFRRVTFSVNAITEHGDVAGAVRHDVIDSMRNVSHNLDQLQNAMRAIIRLREKK